MKLPMFSSYLYDDREDFQIILSELELLLYINSLNNKVSGLLFETLKREGWQLACTNDALIAIVVSVLLNEEVDEGCDFFYVPITDNMAMRLSEYDTADFRDLFIYDNLHPCFDWLVSNFFYDFRSEECDGAKYSSYAIWYDIEYTDETDIKKFDIPFSEYIKSEILQLDERVGCHFLKMDFQYVEPGWVGEAFFNVYDLDYLFRINVLKKEEECEKESENERGDIKHNSCCEGL